MLGKAFTIGALFALARRATREAKMDELRTTTMLAGRENRHTRERMSQEGNLQQMRANSNAQLRMSLAGSGVSPMLTMGGGGGGIQAAHIQQAAVNNSRLGTELKGFHG